MAEASVLVCGGCGYRVPLEEAYPFRCPRARAGDDVDHVLRRRLSIAALDAGSVRAAFADPEPNPFLRYRRLLHVYLVGRRRGLTDDGYLARVEELDQAVAAVDGIGFRETPFGREPGLERATGAAGVWVKNETGNVAGSHKGRHLMGVMIWLATMGRLDHRRAARDELLAAASCGNAGLAAAVVARAAGRQLEVYVPDHAQGSVLERMQRLEAVPVTCRRTAAGAGDPCYEQLHESLARGSLPFTCQGNENGLVADGGLTLAWEMVSRLRAEGAELDRLFVQVGGGALAAACCQALREALELGLIARLPRIHGVQTASCYPLWRAWRRVVGRLLGLPADDAPAAPAEAAAWAEEAARQPPARLAEALANAASHRSEFMRPWPGEPASVAYSILDDETYDWLAVVEGMLVSGGWPVVLAEDEILAGRELARAATAIPADATGTAGLAACLAASRARLDLSAESVGVLFTGVERTAT